MAINFFVNVIGSCLYLIGSACFLPLINENDLGVDYFIYGPVVICVSQVWKLIRDFFDTGKYSNETWEKDPSGVMIDLWAGIGGFSYFAGCYFFFEKTTYFPNLAYQGAIFYIIGGTSFFITAFFILKRYFW